MKTKFLGSMLLLASTMMMGSAYAVTCGTPIPLVTLDTTDVTFRNNPADDCFGPGLGNPTGDSGLALLNGFNVFGAADWEAYLKDDSPGGSGSGSTTYLGIDWALSADSGTEGTWMLTLVDAHDVALPVSLDLAAVFKSATGYAAYFFDNEVFSAVGDNYGTFLLKVLTPNGKNIADLSHLEIFMRPGALPPPPPCDTGGDCEPEEIPEPNSVALIGLGMLGVAMTYLRKRAC